MFNTSRRNFLGSAAAAAGAYSVGNISGCGAPVPEQPVAQKTRTRPLDGIDRENIKITDITVRLFSYPCPEEKWWYGAGVTTLTEVYTDQGIVGIGGPSPYSRPERIKEYTEGIIKPALLGKNPFDVELLTCGEGSAWAGVDVALWDIIGKAKKMPVYK